MQKYPLETWHGCLGAVISLLSGNGEILLHNSYPQHLNWHKICKVTWWTRWCHWSHIKIAGISCTRALSRCYTAAHKAIPVKPLAQEWQWGAGSGDNFSRTAAEGVGCSWQRCCTPQQLCPDQKQCKWIRKCNSIWKPRKKEPARNSLENAS